MATIINKPCDAFINGQITVGKFCMSDEEAAIATRQYNKDMLEAIRIVSEYETEIKEDEDAMTNYIRMNENKSWFQRMKDKVVDTHDSVVSWYEDWKTGIKEDPQKTFEENIEEVRIYIAETRRLEKEDPGYEC